MSWDWCPQDQLRQPSGHCESYRERPRRDRARSSVPGARAREGSPGSPDTRGRLTRLRVGVLPKRAKPSPQRAPHLRKRAPVRVGSVLRRHRLGSWSRRPPARPRCGGRINRRAAGAGAPRAGAAQAPNSDRSQLAVAWLGTERACSPPRAWQPSSRRRSDRTGTVRMVSRVGCVLGSSARRLVSRLDGR
jgi:hypothetical protein